MDNIKIKMEEERIIEIRNLSKQFRNKGNIAKAVDDISLDIFKGKIYGFVGHNGSGKTTTIKMILGLIRPSSGEIKVNWGGHVKNYSLGYVPERPVLYDDMDPLEYLIYVGELSGLDTETSRKNAENYIKIFGLVEAKDKKIKTFSSGMKQKILISQALLHSPSLMILDEPTTALDPVEQKKLLDILKNLSKENGSTIIMSSHHLQELEMIADHVFLFENGKIILDSPIKELKKSIKGQVEIKTTNCEKVFNILRSQLSIINMIIVGDKIIIKDDRLDSASFKNKIIQTIINSGEDVLSIVTSSKSFYDSIMEKLKK